MKDTRAPLFAEEGNEKEERKKKKKKRKEKGRRVNLIHPRVKFAAWRILRLDGDSKTAVGVGGGGGRASTVQ